MTDTQQTPGNDGKLAVKVTGVPSPELIWYKNDEPIRESDRVKFKRDGENAQMIIKNCRMEDAGFYKCQARNREGMDSTEAHFDVVHKM